MSPLSQQPSTLRRRVGGLLQPGPDQASIRRDVSRLALPSMGEQLLSMMVGIVDAYLVGHLGAASLAAVGLANQWVMMATTLFGAIATGSTALIARFIGASEPEDANRVVQQSVLLGILIGLFATLLGVTLAEPAVRLLGAPPDVVDLSHDYLEVVAYLFAIVFGWGLSGACGRLIFDFSTRGIINFLRFRSGRWKTVEV